MTTTRQRGTILLAFKTAVHPLSGLRWTSGVRWARRLLLAGPLVATMLLVVPSAEAVSGTVTQYPVPGTCICEGIATGSDGALWFTEFYDQVVGRMTTTGAVTEFRFAIQPNIARYIAAGPDGALWVTLVDEIGGHGQIGRITTRGAMSMFAIPGISYIDDIAAGPDGALWITDNLGKIDRMTTTGKVTEFPLSLPSGAYPERITAGPDGNLWFTVYNAAMVGKITPVGKVSLFRLPGTLTLTNAIATGPDKALWFTRDGQGAQLGRITIAGTVTVYTLPNASDYTYTGGITAGLDGALWLTRQDYNTNVSWVVRSTTLGQFTPYAIPVPGGGPQGIAQGPDSAVWFAESGHIGRVATR